VGQDLTIYSNATLTNVDALSSLTSVGGGLYIQSNELLDQCVGLLKLVDQWDDAEPGPGPGVAGIPDIGGDVILLGNSSGCNSIEEILVSVPLLQINAGLNDAWVNDDAPFQGMFITVFPELKLMFVAWFTFDSEQPPEDAMAVFGAPDQRWVTALGSYDGNRAELKAELTTGGSFNSSSPIPNQDTNYGAVNFEMSHCNLISVEYDFPAANESGFFSATRAVESNVALCEELNAAAQQ
jgi:hypothetical protein